MKEIFQSIATSDSLWAPVLFVALYAGSTVVFIPGSVLTLGAGAAFGLGKGFVLVSLASTLAAAISFLLGRFFLRKWVAGKLAGRNKFVAIDAAVGREGWKIVGLLRLSPVFPFTLLNYALGVTSVPFGQYVLASWIGMMPGTLLYVYLGSIAHSAASDVPQTPASRAFFWAGLAATVVATVMVTRLSRKALAERLTPVPEAPRA